MFILSSISISLDLEADDLEPFSPVLHRHEERPKRRRSRSGSDFSQSSTPKLQAPSLQELHLSLLDIMCYISIVFIAKYKYSNIIIIYMSNILLYMYSIYVHSKSARRRLSRRR